MPNDASTIFTILDSHISPSAIVALGLNGGEIGVYQVDQRVFLETSSVLPMTFANFIRGC
jgi:hypothetical protein